MDVLMEETNLPRDELQRLKIAVEELSILNDLAVAAGSTLEEEKMLDIIVHKSIKALHAEQGAIQLITEQADSPLRTLIRELDSSSRILDYKVGINITGWVLKYQKPLVIADLATDTRFLTTEQERSEIHSLLCVPIRHRDQLLGVLMVVNRKGSEAFSEDDQRLLSIIASQSGQLIHNMKLQQSELEERRLKQELELAHKIQQKLLPKEDPTCRLFEVAACYEPAEAVAGDYYDYFYRDEQLSGIVIADVSGHGTSAAMVMTLVKGILCSVTQKNQSPAQILTEVNAILCKILPRQMFVTMIFIQLDPSHKRLRFASAGHTPLVFYQSQSNSCQMMECRATALGLKSEVQYEEKELAVASGDFIFAYTDGVTEAADAEHQLFGEERLIHSVCASCAESASDIICRVRQDVRDFLGHTLHEDDIAMIGIKIKP